MLLDIEELNRRAHDGAFDLTKLSVGAFAGVGDRYRLLRSGAALGHGVGPLVVAREPMPLAEAARGRVAIPGRETTAFRLLRLAAPALGEVVELRYDQILGAVERGEVDAGLIIHESRFTYADHGLSKVADLGDWWERETGLPVPLAGICARADLDAALVAAAERAIRASVAVRLRHPRGEPRLRARALAGDVRRGVRRAHRALRERAQPRPRRRGLRGDRAATPRLAAPGGPSRRSSPTRRAPARSHPGRAAGKAPQPDRAEEAVSRDWYSSAPR